MSPLVAHAALALALAESLALAGVLQLRVRGVAGGLQLVIFLVGVAVWIAGSELPAWFGPGAIPVATRMIALSSLTAAVFLHFTISFTKAKVPRGAIFACYALGAATTLLAILYPPGDFGPWAGFDYVFKPNRLGWAVGMMWALFGTLGHLILALSWFGQSAARRRQLVAVCLASGLGLASMSGYAFVAVGIAIYPFPLLLLPLYPLILVYGILRYELMVENAWARRALAFTLLAGCGVVLVGALAVIPLPIGSSAGIWTARAAIVVLAMALVDPMRRLATRIVYPGLQITDELLSTWRQKLDPQLSYEELAVEAAEILSRQLRMAIAVTVAPDASPRGGAVATITCSKLSGRWRCTLSGWEGSPPGPIYGAHAFGAVLAEAASHLEHAQELAARERETQQQARLAELGALAATVAHDIRNPLNIISMAAAGSPPELRKEISIQVQRISRLAQDLLDYSKSWRFEPRKLDLALEVRRAAVQYPGVALAPALDNALEVWSDPQRLNQALVNLLDNAVAAYPDGTPAISIGIDADQLPDGGTRLHICDGGQGVPPAIRDSLFQPFVSRGPNGTGLGLAIVAKVMAAHQGTVELTERPGWKTCFSLSFPPVTPP